MNSGLPAKELAPLIKEVVEKNGEFRLYPKGVSMLPTIREGIDSVVLVKAEDIKKYDILFYLRDNGQYVMHRLIGLKGNNFIFCGDNQFEKELFKNKQNIIAKVKGFYRNDKYISGRDRKHLAFIKCWYMVLPMRLYLSKFIRLTKKIGRKFISSN